ncbi:hypothetical protein J2T12_004932 [Paenibacillus anaericanus]|nr:hypothetical protein [Paenibacillus anaericanus]
MIQKVMRLGGQFGDVLWSGLYFGSFMVVVAD